MTDETTTGIKNVSERPEEAISRPDNEAADEKKTFPFVSGATSSLKLHKYSPEQLWTLSWSNSLDISQS